MGLKKEFFSGEEGFVHKENARDYLFLDWRLFLLDNTTNFVGVYPQE